MLLKVLVLQVSQLVSFVDFALALVGVEDLRVKLDVWHDEDPVFQHFQL